MGAKPAKVTRQTFIELGLLLSDNTKPTDIDHDLMITLQTEELYLPLIELSNQFWLTGALCYRLKKLKIFSQLPHILQQYLNEVSTLYRQRNIDIKQETTDIHQLLADANIEHILLKGAASLFNATYPSPAMRYMCDVDILVNPEQQQQAFSLLEQYGYQTDEAPYALHSDNHHHAPSLCKPNSMCGIEIHRQGLKAPASEVLSDTCMWQGAEPLVVRGELTCWQLNPTDQAIHCIAHSEISHFGYRQKHLDLRQFYHLYRLICHYQQDIDWRRVEKHFQLVNQQGLLQATLQGIALLFNQLTPVTRDNSAAKQHIEQRIRIFCQDSKLRQKWLKLSRILSGYGREQIAFTYNVSGILGIAKARCRHLMRHVKLLLNSEYRHNFWAE
ncbi:nucleotidyltransferase family protein [Thalassotalea mangrovi]|uniref:Nucleotidyltransferase family protein n=1 Tax=Thalassotalea mangrovi TaxID=2572245 RepID=A0A4U1B3S0_9GAMM|nr:nucleotidyltransferase family protein [Thalassotalea mangrovi]TKB44659.1 hypothetical protein E8M12_11010 [Thalassotalea mangrovi]